MRFNIESSGVRESPVIRQGIAGLQGKDRTGGSPVHSHEVHMISVYGDLHTVSPQDRPFSLLGRLRGTLLSRIRKRSMQGDCEGKHIISALIYCSNPSDTEAVASKYYNIAIAAVLGHGHCRAAQAQPRGHECGPCGNGLLHQRKQNICLAISRCLPPCVRPLHIQVCQGCRTGCPKPWMVLLM